MSQAGLDRKKGDLSAKERTLLLIFAPVLFVIAVVSLGTPIPRGQADRKAIVALLQELYPDREVAPAKESTAPVAVLFHLIRSAEPEVARRAIMFAANHELGYTAPYVIERLGSGDADLEAAAQDFLRAIAGADYGPDAAAWRAWWRNPPRELLGFVVGQQTFAIAVPLSTAAAAVLLIWLGARRGLPTASALGGVLLVVLWLNLWSLAVVRLVGKQHVCTFGETRITYFSGKGAVVGLEDARLAGEWFVFVLLAASVIGVFLLAWAFGAAHDYWSTKANGAS